MSDRSMAEQDLTQPQVEFAQKLAQLQSGGELRGDLHVESDVSSNSSFGDEPLPLPSPKEPASISAPKADKQPVSAAYEGAPSKQNHLEINKQAQAIPQSHLSSRTLTVPSPSSTGQHDVLPAFTTPKVSQSDLTQKDPCNHPPLLRVPPSCVCLLLRVPSSTCPLSCACPLLRVPPSPCPLSYAAPLLHTLSLPVVYAWLSRPCESRPCLPLSHSTIRSMRASWWSKSIVESAD